MPNFLYFTLVPHRNVSLYFTVGIRTAPKCQSPCRMHLYRVPVIKTFSSLVTMNRRPRRLLSLKSTYAPSVIGPLDIHTQKSRLAARSLTTIQSLSLSRSGKFVHVSPVFPNQDRLSCRLHYPRLEPVYPREMRATFLAVVKPIRTGASLGLI